MSFFFFELRFTWNLTSSGIRHRAFWYLFIYLLTLSMLHDLVILHALEVNSHNTVTYTEWPKKMYTLFTHQYLWNKFK